MSESKSFASLTPTLLARKGGAKPAMRPQLAPLHHFHEATARQFDDLGWNDMGGEIADDRPDTPLHEAEIVQLKGNAQGAPPAPEVLRQRDSVASGVARMNRERRSALDNGRRAAFTLRLDADRHLQLRLASTISNRSAQQVVTEALDRLLAEMPEVAALAGQVRKRG